MKKFNIYIGNSLNLLSFRNFDIGVKLLLICIICTFNAATNPLLAQQDLHLTQQIFSRMNVNPAATGNTADVDIFLLGRFFTIFIAFDEVTQTSALHLSSAVELM